MTENKLALLRGSMDEKGVDAVLITNPNNRYYLSGFSGSAGCLVVTRLTAHLFTDFRYTVQARQEAPCFDVVEINNNLYTSLNNLLNEQRVSSLGFEDAHLSFANYNAIYQKLEAKQMVSMENSVSALRKTKYPYEIERINAAARLADESFKYILENIREQMTEIEVAAMLETHMRKHGALKPSFETIVASGARAALPHGVASGKSLCRGDFVVIDFGCVLDGYCSDLTRTIVIGEASERQKELYNIVLYTQVKAIDSVACGMQASELDSVARGILEGFGYGEQFGHGLGHGVGISVHEAPTVSKLSKDILTHNSVITIEPGVYIQDFGGVRIEDMIVVGESGNFNLTASPKELIVI